VFSPASSAYLELLNQAWLERPGRTRPLAPAGEPLVLSPLVIGMWRPMAEALGWPNRALGWRDIVDVSGRAEGWAAFGHPEWGAFKLGHTHPEFSTSGLLSVLAEAYAGLGKKRRLEADDLARPEVRALMGGVERAIVHYGKSTGFFADQMLERGPEYLSAAVLYENLVVEAARPSTRPPLVAIYPKEGTFWADHPYAVLDAEWVGPEERAAAQAFLTFLSARPQQERAAAHGFRPADTRLAIGAPIDPSHGADPEQPKTLLEVPAAPALARLLEVWRTVKRPADVVLVFDKSGSMAGPALASAQRGALSFLDTLHDRDLVTLLPFDSVLHPPEGPLELPAGHAALSARVDAVRAGGGTVLYDAIARAFEESVRRATSDRARNHAVVVMTDGRDEGSRLSLAELNTRLSAPGAVRVFTIAYGDQASAPVLGAIARAAGGTFARGDAATIGRVFEDVASFF
jgi:Ca-activated chloride channel family protein